MSFPNDPHVRYAAKSTYFIDAEVRASDCRMLYILSGEGHFDSDGVCHPLSAGALVYYPAGAPYHIHSDEGILFYTLNFDFTQDYSAQYKLPFVPQRSGIELPLLSEGIPASFSTLLYFPHAFFAEHHLRRIYEESVRPSPFAERAQSAALTLLLIDLARQGAAPQRSPLVLRIKALVEEDLHRNNTDVARLLNYHPYYLNEVFVREEGISLYQYIKGERLAKAREWITVSNLPLEEIADACGFSSSSHLSRVIRAEYGVSPSHLRKL